MLVYDADTDRAPCAPWELGRTRNEELRPGQREEWLDVQARALAQACQRTERIVGMLGYPRKPRAVGVHPPAGASLPHGRGSGTCTPSPHIHARSHSAGTCP